MTSILKDLQDPLIQKSSSDDTRQSFSPYLWQKEGEPACLPDSQSEIEQFKEKKIDYIAGENFMNRVQDADIVPQQYKLKERGSLNVKDLVRGNKSDAKPQRKYKGSFLQKSLGLFASDQSLDSQQDYINVDQQIKNSQNDFKKMEQQLYLQDPSIKDVLFQKYIDKFVEYTKPDGQLDQIAERIYNQESSQSKTLYHRSFAFNNYLKQIVQIEQALGYDMDNSVPKLTLKLQIPRNLFDLQNIMGLPQEIINDFDSDQDEMVSEEFTIIEF